MTDKTQKDINAAADASTYEVIPQNIRYIDYSHRYFHLLVLSYCCRGDVGMEMKPNAAYGPVSSSLPRPRVAAGSEDTYEAV